MTGQYPDSRSEAEWKECLTEEQYRVLREKGTERAFTGAYWDRKTPGVYRCGACDTELFHSETKYDSGSGWPSFYDAIDKSRIEQKVDRSHYMERVEILCANCGSHLGHEFPDGPQPTGVRYCVNSVSLKFEDQN